jgi:hypothetical protein
MSYASNRVEAMDGYDTKLPVVMLNYTRCIHLGRPLDQSAFYFIHSQESTRHMQPHL